MKYAGIIQNDIADSITGVNVSFWVQGCPLHCTGCHNPQTWDFDGGIDLPNNYLDIIDSYMNANGIKRGLSILGGEPFAKHNKFIIHNIVTHVKDKFPDRKIYIWTGFQFENLIKIYPNYDTISKIDFLIDGPFIKEKRDVTLKLRGSSNQRIIDVQKTLKNNKIVLLDMS